MSGWTLGAFGASAASADETAGPGSYSTCTRSAASRAASADSAITATTGKPTHATRPRASGGCGATFAKGIGMTGTSARSGTSSPVTTATTPGADFASDTSTLVIRAAA